MARSSLKKDRYRTIKNSLDRFFSIAIIVALGVAFFIGLKTAPIAMKNTLNSYYEKYNLADFEMVSTLGLTEDDLFDTESLGYVNKAEGVYNIPGTTVINDKEVTLDVNSFEDEDQINGLKVIRGRLPSNEGEAVVESNKEGKPLVPIGSQIEISTDINVKDDAGNKVNPLKTRRFTVVGSVNSPVYLFSEKSKLLYSGLSSNSYIYINKKDFNLPTFTKILIKLDKRPEQKAYSDKYTSLIDDNQDELKEMLSGFVTRRKRSITDKAVAKIRYEQAKLNDAKSKADKKLTDAEVELKTNETRLDYLSSANYNGLDTPLSRNEIDSALRDVDSGKERLKNEKKKTNEQLKAANDKLNSTLKEAEKPIDARYFLLDRNSYLSYFDYGESTKKVDSISKVFPVFFVIVAFLVCLTTITRMVDEERGNIGLLKALGYTNYQIEQKYRFYSTSAASVGAALGIVFGILIFPKIVYDNYGLMYVIPKMKYTIAPSLCIATFIASVALTSFTATLACAKDLEETPITLFMPKAPQVGKSIFLEKVGFIWKRLSFIKKVTFRNIFRYKKRFFMTIFGIGGCCALLVSAFGLKNSIEAIIDEQYGQITLYDGVFSLKENPNLGSVINNSRSISILPFYEDNVTVESGGKDKKVLLNVFVDGDKGNGYIANNTKNEINNENSLSINGKSCIRDLDKYISLLDYKTEKKLSLTDDGAIITEQYAKNLHLKIGHEFEFKDIDGITYSAKVVDISKNYLTNYIFMTQRYYEKVTGKDSKFKINKAYFNINGGKITNHKEADKIKSEYEKNPNIALVDLSYDRIDNLNYTVKSIRSVFLLMVVSAGALAFVVMYNLTNINIGERIREIATIKVLGFYDLEVAEYVYRENIILSIIGILLGFAMGIGLHRIIISTFEMDNMMFPKSIQNMSFLYSFLLTVLFSLLVNGAMYFKLVRIKMVESLKSVE